MPPPRRLPASRRTGRTLPRSEVRSGSDLRAGSTRRVRRGAGHGGRPLGQPRRPPRTGRPLGALHRSRGGPPAAWGIRRPSGDLLARRVGRGDRRVGDRHDPRLGQAPPRNVGRRATRRVVPDPTRPASRGHGGPCRTGFDQPGGRRAPGAVPLPNPRRPTDSRVLSPTGGGGRGVPRRRGGRSGPPSTGRTTHPDHLPPGR